MKIAIEVDQAVAVVAYHHIGDFHEHHRVRPNRLPLDNPPFQAREGICQDGRAKEPAVQVCCSKRAFIGSLVMPAKCRASS